MLFFLGQYYTPLSGAGVVVTEDISSPFVLGVRREVLALVDELVPCGCRPGRVGNGIT